MNQNNTKNIEVEGKLGFPEFNQDINPDSAKLSVFTAKDTNLNKSFQYIDDVLIKTTNGRLVDGEVNVSSIENLRDLKATIENLKSNQVISIGTPVIGGNQVSHAKITTKSKFAYLESSDPTVPRTKEYFEFPKNQKALLFFDIDSYEGTPSDLWNALCMVDPQLKDVGRLVVNSSSSNIYSAETGENLNPKSGYHIYCIVRDGSDIPRYGEVLSKKLWLAGHGFIMISSAGSFLERQIIDSSVFSPERLIFESAPDLDKSLIQTRPIPELIDGETIDTSLLKNLSDNEYHKYQKMVLDAKNKLKPEQKFFQESYVCKEVAKLTKHSRIEESEARQTILKSLKNGVLYSDQLLNFDKFGEVSVKEVFANSEKFDQATMSDPMEWKYNGGVNMAILYWNKGNPVIHSFAHGGRKYELKDMTVGADDTAIALNQKLEDGVFPDTKLSNGTVKATKSNFETLLKEYGITAEYDLISKKQYLKFPKEYKECADLEANAKIAELKSLCALNGVPLGSVDLLTALYSDNEINPVVDYISGIEWDGVDRLVDFTNSIVVNEKSAELLPFVIRKWMIQSVAAADGGERTPNKSAMKKYENIMIFAGNQGVGKTEFFNRLIPVKLRKYFLDGAHLDPKDKDSVTYCINHWIVELGEIDTTFRKADIAALKAFLSSTQDVLRLPYDKRNSEFQRRTSFCASVNEQQFLVDPTGNRRYWTIAVDSFNDHDIDMDQLWAQVWHLYIDGEQWWEDAEMKNLLLKSQKEHKQIDPIEDALADHFDLTKVNQGKLYSYNHILQIIQFAKSQRNSGLIGNILTEKGFDRTRNSKGRGFVLSKNSDHAVCEGYGF